MTAFRRIKEKINCIHRLENASYNPKGSNVKENMGLRFKGLGTYVVHLSFSPLATSPEGHGTWHQRPSPPQQNGWGRGVCNKHRGARQVAKNPKGSKLSVSPHSDAHGLSRAAPE